MENEYQVLTHLQDNEETSQRKISQRTVLSLGAVNILTKKMVRKGLIKVEHLNSRTMRYILFYKFSLIDLLKELHLLNRVHKLGIKRKSTVTWRSGYTRGSTERNY